MRKHLANRAPRFSRYVRTAGGRFRTRRTRASGSWFAERRGSHSHGFAGKSFRSAAALDRAAPSPPATPPEFVWVQSATCCVAHYRPLERRRQLHLTGETLAPATDRPRRRPPSPDWHATSTEAALEARGATACELALALTLAALPAAASERWQILPPTPAAIATSRSGLARVNGIRVYYAVYGRGSPVIVLHGRVCKRRLSGRKSLVRVRRHTVIGDGQPRHTGGATARRFARSATDARWPTTSSALRCCLRVLKADVVGWSDGDDLPLTLCLRRPSRVGKIFSFAANTVTSGVKPNLERNPTFGAFMSRADHEYARCPRRPAKAAFIKQISAMWANQPNWTSAQLRTIRSPVLVVDGDHDEAIERSHTEYIAATIPGAGLLILPNAWPLCVPAKIHRRSTSRSCILGDE